MSSDLVERLRVTVQRGHYSYAVNPDGPEAADALEARDKEIARLRKFNRELRRYMYDRTPERREMVCERFPEFPFNSDEPAQ